MLHLRVFTLRIRLRLRCGMRFCEPFKTSQLGYNKFVFLVASFKCCGGVVIDRKKGVVYIEQCCKLSLIWQLQKSGRAGE